MKKVFWFSLLIIISLASCATKKKDSSKSNKEKNEFILIDEKESVGEKTMKLSDLIDDYRIIKFENSDSAIFRVRKPVVSKNYVAFIQGNSQPVVLFDKNGKFICKVGNIGQGPGEYSMAYDALIDEQRNKIYITEMVSENIYVYDLEGNYILTHKIGNLQKSSLFLNEDGSISVISLAFGDLAEPLTAATVGRDSIKRLVYPPLISNFRDQSGRGVGFDNEVWVYRNSDNNGFMMTINDTLYNYDPVKNIVSPRAFLKEKSSKNPESWYLGLELPQAIVYNIVGPEGRTIWYDKVTEEISKMNIVNDFLGNAPVSTGSFRDGYFVQVWEPGQLIDRIKERWLPQNDMTTQQRDDLNRLLSELNPDENNIMLIGRLK